MNARARSIRVFIVDDHPIVRRGFSQLLDNEPDLQVCGEAADAPSALSTLPAAAADVVLVDISLGASNGLDLVREIRSLLPAAVVLVVSMHDEILYAERALRAGASGYVMKHEATEVIVRAVRTVARGGTYVSDAVSTRMLKRLSAPSRGAIESSPLDALSDRELHVFRRIGEGRGTREIAEELGISVKTVESYRARLKDKMNLKSASELLRCAAQWADGAIRR